MPKSEGQGTELAKRIAAARAQLIEEMERLGMAAKDGWTVHEQERNAPGGKMYTLSPAHPTQATPPGYLVALKIPD